MRVWKIILERKSNNDRHLLHVGAISGKDAMRVGIRCMHNMLKEENPSYNVYLDSFDIVGLTLITVVDVAQKLDSTKLEKYA